MHVHTDTKRTKDVMFRLDGIDFHDENVVDDTYSHADVL